MKTNRAFVFYLLITALVSCTKEVKTETAAANNNMNDAAALATAQDPVILTNSKTAFAVIDAITGQTLRFTNKYGANFNLSQAPLAVGQRLIIPLGNIIRCVDLKTSQTLWQTAISHAANAIHTTSALCTDGKNVFVTLEQENGSSGNLIYHKFFALNIADGSISWQSTITNRANVFSGIRELPAPATGDGKVYVPLKDTLYAYDASTGAELWRFTTPAINIQAFNPVFSNGRLFFTMGTSSLFALDAVTGKVLWKDDFGINSLPDINAAVADGGGVYLNTSGGVVCVNPSNGNVKWTTTLSPLFGVFTPVFLSGDLVVTTASGGTANLTVYAINKSSGQLVWQTSHAPKVSSNILNRGASVSNNTIFVKSIEGFITAFNLSDGIFLWENYIPSFSSIYMHVIVSDTNTVYTALSGMY